jgi:hypothetical protein
MTPCESPPPPCIPIGRLGFIYDSQLDKIHKNTTTIRWKLLLFDKISPTFLCEKPLKRYHLKAFCEEKV